MKPKDVTPKTGPPAKIQPGKIQFAPLVAPEPIEVSSPIPEEFIREDTVEAPASLNPQVDWQKPLQSVWGTYLGMQEGIGPNKSRLYELRVDSGEVIVVWGATILDQKMNRLDPPVGSRLFIQYLGDVPTARGLNPAKQFRVMYYKK